MLRKRSSHGVLALTVSPSLCAAASPAPVGAGQALQVVVGLLIVLGLIVAAAWGARRLQAIRPQGSGRLRVIEGLAVGSREKLLLVEVDGRPVLLGLCPGRIATLHPFSFGALAPAFDDALRAAGRDLAGDAS